MKLVHVAAVSTAVVIALGLAMVAPIFIRDRQYEPPRKVLLFFRVTGNEGAFEWCSQLSDVLQENNVSGTVFMAGNVADVHPQCVAVFGDGIDIGSMTYSYVNLTEIRDYSIQLEEVGKGKQAVDNAGRLDSRLFRAPFGSVDDNIYSLLNRSGIIADFSYDSHYNKYWQGQFIRFDLTVYDGFSYTKEFFLNLPNTDEPVGIMFDNSVPIKSIRELVLALKSGNVRFINASELTGLPLTIRQGE